MLIYFTQCVSYLLCTIVSVLFRIITNDYKYVCIIYFLEIYKKFDGAIHPKLDHDKLKELQSKEVSQQPWWKSIAGTVTKFVKSYVPSSGESKFKHLPIVKTYLASYCKFITGETNLNLNPVEVIDEIVYTVQSLIKSYFYVENNRCCLLASDIKKVKKCLFLCFSFFKRTEMELSNLMIHVSIMD